MAPLIPALAVAAALASAPPATHAIAPADPGAWTLHLAGGLILVDTGAPGLPPIPILTGDAIAAVGVVPGMEARVRYTSHLGVVHRLGPELRFLTARGSAGAFGWAVTTNAQLVGAAAEDVDVGGDLSSTLSVLGTVTPGDAALTVELGFTIQWLLFERFAGKTHVDDTPFPAYVELAASAEFPTSPSATFALRLELAVPLAPDDPWAVGGVYPRLVVGGTFGLSATPREVAAPAEPRRASPPP